MKKRHLGNINAIVNVIIVMFIFMEWSLKLEALFYCITKLAGKSPFQLDISPEPIFRESFSIIICDVNKSPSQLDS